MTPERWQRVEELYHAAHDEPADARAAFLAEACRGDEALRREVELLLSQPSHDGFLAAPSLETASALIPDLPQDMTGHSVGTYHLDVLLGAGGMGEVYRSHDARLGRDVAIKILPRAFTSHPDRLARLEREARMLAALNHPNICAIYGFEQADGIRFLVLELVEGETLAVRIAEGRARSASPGMPLPEAVTIARQIADALEIAHDKGIVHRDLKPANVKITPDGIVKVLDFGLAKAVTADGSSPEITQAPTEAEGEPRRGAVIGTPAYMSPEQARGLTVDKRTDIWAFGCVLYEMLTGRVAFKGETISDSIARILEREPDWSALPPATPSSVRRLLLRCLTKDPKKRLRDIGDARIEIDAMDELLPGSTAALASVAGRRGVRFWVPWVALASLVLMVGAREGLRPVSRENPLPSEGFRPLTDWPGSEGYAEISPDGKVVAFLADRDGELDLFAGLVATGDFKNLTENIEPLSNPVAVLRSTGFFPDSARLWFGLGPRQKVEMPWSGGSPRPFLMDGDHTPAWSSDGRLVYFNNLPGDYLWTADGAGRNARQLEIEWPGSPGKEAYEAYHNHNMVWSPDDKWIYLVHGTTRDVSRPTVEMDIWRISPSGASPERLTYLNTQLSFLAMLDPETLVFIAPDESGFGSWLWSLDIGTLRTTRRFWGAERAVPQRIPTGTQQYTSISASRNRGPVVVTRANPTASLFSVPIRVDRQATEAEVVPVRVQTERALAPRYARRTVSPLLFFLSARGTGDRVWRFETAAVEITKGAEGHLIERPAPAPDGKRVAVVVKESGYRRLAVMNEHGQGSQILAGSIDILGAPDWSPDGKWLAAGGRDKEGAGLFAIPVDGGTPRRLVSAVANDPVWSPDGDFIVYSGYFSGGTATTRVAGAPLRAVRSDGTKYDLPLVTWPSGSREDLRVAPDGYRFLDQTHLVYRPRPEMLDFWLFDLVTGEQRQITRLGNKGSVRSFDVTPDGKQIVFDRIRQNSDVVLIDLPRR
ncbi:MAG TPA: LpqB family beta-propeller domain-containing protein [Vicinamibacterales bacterium]|nr:LpqB family beta-propeller domain-containing protein [Vicinamibacterales bacterium]